MMKDGVYYVIFKSSAGAFGEGVLVVQQGCVNGGDVGFVYQGRLMRPEMTLHIKRHHEDIPSVLGMESDYELVMRYEKEREGEYRLQGYAKDSPVLTIEGHAGFLAPLLTPLETHI
ncbi:nucleoside transporter [Salmonella enterica]